MSKQERREKILRLKENKIKANGKQKVDIMTLNASHI